MNRFVTWGLAIRVEKLMLNPAFWRARTPIATALAALFAFGIALAQRTSIDSNLQTDSKGYKYRPERAPAWPSLQSISSKIVSGSKPLNPAA
jgi:hypothetical protein